MASLDGRVAFVTGGAHGIGRACVERLQPPGRPWCSATSTPTAATRSPRRWREGAPVEFVEVRRDVEEQVAAVTALAIERFGSLDVVVANAGIDVPFDAATMTEDEWDAFLAIDLKSVWLSVKYALPQMRGQRRGSIVTIASIHAFVTSTGKFPYAAAKSGVVGLTRSLALDEGKHRIRVNAVCPGYTRTRMVMAWSRRTIRRRPSGRCSRSIRSAASPSRSRSRTSWRSWHPTRRASSPVPRSWSTAG